MEDRWLSVIIPSHNGERWLASALQSIVEQRESGIEIILVDSSASNASLQIAANFAGKLDLRTYRRLDLVPWTAKTNFGVQQARADWVCMLHQDDLWLPNRCLALRRWLWRRPDAVMYLHSVLIIDEHGRKLGAWRCPLPASEAPVPPQLMFERLLIQDFISIAAPTIRRDAFFRVGGLDNMLRQTADWDLFLKLSGAGEIYYDPEPLACFRIHRTSLTFANARKLSDYRNQLEVVLNRHAATLELEARQAILPLAKMSIDMNIALAAANNGNPVKLIRALGSLLRLGPHNMWSYIIYSRILERTLPRIWARLAHRL